jgi:cell division protein FtsX
MAAYDDLNVKRIFVVGIASVVVTAVTALAVQVLYYTMAQAQTAETQAESNYDRQNAYLQGQVDQVSTYGVDEATGNIVIPVEKAIEQMLEENSILKSIGPQATKASSDET